MDSRALSDSVPAPAINAALLTEAAYESTLIRASFRQAWRDLTYLCLPLTIGHIRATIRLDDRLLTEAKIYAAESGRTLTALVEDALRESLARRREASAHAPVRLKTVKGCDLHDGVDLDNSASLLDLIANESPRIGISGASEDCTGATRLAE